MRVSVDPGAEWRQMFREAWRLQRDHYWAADMGGIDWEALRERYAPLVERVGSRAELSDLLWDLQGELRTSHAYEMFGDYRPSPKYAQGFLGADVVYDEARGGWIVERVPRGDSWIPEAASPLAAPGVDVRAGARIAAVGGRRLDAGRSPFACLVHRAGECVELTVVDAGGAPGSDRERRVTVRALKDETLLRYRDWVRANREHVHRATGGRMGYLHLPDMGRARLRGVRPRLPAGDEPRRAGDRRALQRRRARLPARARAPDAAPARLLPAALGTPRRPGPSTRSTAPWWR